MKVLLDLTPAVQQHAGLGRYAEELACALAGVRSGDELRLFYTDRLGRLPAPPLEALPRKSLRWPNKPWRMAALLASYSHIPMDSLFGDIDIFHATDHLLPHLHRISSVFTLYDLSFQRYPETHSPWNRWFLKLMMPRFLTRAQAVICISRYTANDAIAFYGLDASKVYVIPAGVSPHFGPVQESETLARVRARYNLPEKFILFVSTIEPRKNLATLLEAYQMLRSEGWTGSLVVVGRKGWLYQRTFTRLRELGLEGQVIFSGYVEEADLPAVYSTAEVFSFPSLFEGFGFTPLEAMGCGCPVVCSNASSLPEVCGDAALLVPPTNVRALKSALSSVLDDPGLRERLRARGLRQAARFTWSEAANRTLALYRTVLQDCQLSAEDNGHKKQLPWGKT